MAENAIDKVREAEARADEALRAAAREAERAVGDARQKAAELAVKAEDDAKRQAADRVAAAHSSSRQAMEAASVALAGEMDALRAKARAAQGAAVEKILAALA